MLRARWTRSAFCLYVKNPLLVISVFQTRFKTTETIFIGRECVGDEQEEEAPFPPSALLVSSALARVDSGRYGLGHLIRRPACPAWWAPPPGPSIRGGADPKQTPCCTTTQEVPPASPAPCVMHVLPPIHCYLVASTHRSESPGTPTFTSSKLLTAH